MRNGMVIVSIALSLHLLVGVSLMIRTLFALESVPLGFQPGNVLSVRVPLPEKQYAGAERKIAFFRELLERLETIPGTRAVGVGTGLHPLGDVSAPVELVGAARQDNCRVLIHQVNDTYVRVFGIPLRAGRMFGEVDIASRRHVAVVNEVFVSRYSNGQNPLGRIVRVPRLSTPPFSVADSSFEIIGVTGNVPDQIINDEITPEIFVPYSPPVWPTGW